MTCTSCTSANVEQKNSLTFDARKGKTAWPPWRRHARLQFGHLPVLADDPRRVGHRGQLDRLRHHIEERDAECVQPSPREPRLLRLDVPLRLHPREHQVGLSFTMY